MAQAIDSEAYKAFTEAARYMMSRSPGMSEFYMVADKRQSDEPSVTVRVCMENGHPVLEYGVAFVRSLERSLLGSIIYMQCMKVALHHCDRRRREPSDICKLASDLVVSEYGRNMVDLGVEGNLEIVDRLYPSVWNYWDTFRKYDFDPVKDLTLEKVFDILSDSDRDGDGEGQDDNGDGQSDDGGKDADADATGEESESEGDDDGEGDGDGDGDEGDGSDTDGNTGSYSAMERYFSAETAESDLDGWRKDELASASIQTAAERSDRSGSLERMAGNLPVMIMDANHISVNPAVVFRHFMNSVESDEYDPTWNRRDRRLPGGGPVINPGRRVAETHRVLLAGDVSGSMYFAGVIPKCIQLMDALTDGLAVDVCYWDAVCSEIYDTPRDLSEIDIQGGGSTDPQCVLDRVRDEHRNYDGVVFITDCEFCWECPPHPRNIMIVNTGSRSAPPEWCIHSIGIDELMHER